MKGAFMPTAQTLSVHIARPIAEVYAFLVDPANLSRWTAARNGRHEPKAGLLVWSFDGPAGRVLLHFTRPNPFYVLDYKVSENGQTIHEGYVRLIPAGNDTLVTHIAVQEAEVADAQFVSEAEWLTADLLMLKTLLET
jgi:uncharacterized protein YndB with AHSA1/START domain